ncbi:MAG: ABC transporter ATP-binding protein, partial [Treponema sp.]|nr:ABC transporter ATP-binding protein [Treponema sp.]
EKEALLSIKKLKICVKAPDGILYPAVDGINLDITAGEIHSLVGESGCGKSLTALATGGLLDDGVCQSEGEILFRGKDLCKLKEAEKLKIYGRDIGMVFQEPMTSLDPLMKIGGQVGESLKLHGDKKNKLSKDEIERLVESSLKDVCLDDARQIMEKYPHELSGGMRQRVMIASAMICSPALLIADEPTTALDILTQKQVISLLKNINSANGTAILFISHDIKLVSKISDRISVMYAGKIVEQGKTDDVLNSPAHPYTKALMASVPTRGMKGRPLDCIAGRVPAVTEPKPPCPFAPRCPMATAVCMEKAPQKIENANGHIVFCSFPLRDI